MTATERLRELLDERGVDWWSEDDSEQPSYYFITKWFANGCEQTYEEIPAIRSRSLKAYCITPEQAIAATLGSGTCQNEGDPSDFLCSECGARMFTDTGETYTMIDSLGNIIEQPNYCPNCGRRVEVDA